MAKKNVATFLPPWVEVYADSFNDLLTAKSMPFHLTDKLVVNCAA